MRVRNGCPALTPGALGSWFQIVSLVATAASGDPIFAIDFDFVDHRLLVTTVTGQ
jgi:hypothetical protein